MKKRRTQKCILSNPATFNVCYKTHDRVKIDSLFSPWTLERAPMRSAGHTSTFERRLTSELASWGATGTTGGVFNKEAAAAAGGLSTTGPVGQRQKSKVF